MISKVHMRKPVARASWEEEPRVIYTPALKVIFSLQGSAVSVLRACSS